MPVGTTLMPFASSSAFALSGVSVVAMSMSLTFSPISALRTQPPAKRATPPSAWSAPITALVSASFSQAARASSLSALIGDLPHSLFLIFDRDIKETRHWGP